MRILFLLMVICFATPMTSQTEAAKPENSTKTIVEKTADMQKYSGYFDFYWDENAGKIWLEIDKWDVEFLYLNSLPAGVGSNDIGLDRGQLGARRIVKFQRVGPKVLLVQPNYGFRAITDNRLERESIEQAFSQSVLWGFKVEAEDSSAVLVDASTFFMQDAHNVVGRLKRTNQGNYKLDASRSALYLPRTKNFPENTEIEATLTFTGNPEGMYIRSVTPSPEAVTVRQHHSFIKLPDDGYTPRKLDPRSSYFGIRYLDFATPISEAIEKQYIARHRLEKKDPSAEMSEAVEPIIYYLDNGTPEPIRSALLDGARWWNQAFEAAGFKDAFQVKVLPDDADPMDVRYNVIQWVHRSTRGWSYGDAVYDPRSGEIIKGHISLGSLRVRQDYLIAEGLLAPYEEGKAVSTEMQEMALARLRQLSAHEVGHTLGIAHNFAASPVDRASVMDYPHPKVKITGGKLDLSDAYATGIGEWDKISIRYGYGDFPEGANEAEELEAILQDGFAKGLIFISDTDARPLGGMHPTAHLWDNGSSAVDELAHVMKVRGIALEQFSENNIPIGQPMASLEEALIPMYFFHRYQIEAAAKLLGGMYYTYAMRGDGQKVTEIVAPETQSQALEKLLETLRSDFLSIPPELLAQIPPRAFGMARGREVLNVYTGLSFDPLAAAEASANLTARLILHPQRAGRLLEFHARNNDYPGLAEVIDQLLKSTWYHDAKPGMQSEIQYVVNFVVLYHLMELARNKTAAQQVRAVAFAKLMELGNSLKSARSRGSGEEAHFSYAIAQINKFLRDPAKITIMQPLDPPAGSPIGTNGGNLFQECRAGL